MKTRILTLSFLAAFLFCSCGDPIEPEPVKLDAAGGTQELVLTSGIKPEISCSDNWITLSEGAYASNTVTLRVSAQENTGTAARSTSIRVIGEKQSLMIPVNQGIPQVKLAVSETRVSFDRFGGEAEFSVTSSQKPQVSSDAAWCGVAVGEIGSNHETTVTLLSGANRTTDPRDATVTVKCGSESLTVSVSGEAGKAIPVTSAAALLGRPYRRRPRLAAGRELARPRRRDRGLCGEGRAGRHRKHPSRRELLAGHRQSL